MYDASVECMLLFPNAKRSQICKGKLVFANNSKEDNHK